MPQLGFVEQFAAAVQDGTKRQTIRKLRMDGRDPKVGDTLAFYAGQMAPGKRRKLGEAECTMVARVEISRPRLYVEPPPDGPDPMSFTMDEFAAADGFRDWVDMCEWFNRAYGPSFEGLLIRWGPLQ